MNRYTFCCNAFVSVDADTEEDARRKLSDALYTQDEDVLYGDPSAAVTSIYVTESLTLGEAVLVSIYNYETRTGEFV